MIRCWGWSSITWRCERQSKLIVNKQVVETRRLPKMESGGCSVTELTPSASASSHRPRQVLGRARAWRGRSTSDGATEVVRLVQRSRHRDPTASSSRYWGATRREVEPTIVILGLNPGKFDPQHHARSEALAHELRRLGSCSAWAPSRPYARDPPHLCPHLAPGCRRRLQPRADYGGLPVALARSDRPDARPS
jgi:hypothetical protein